MLYKYVTEGEQWEKASSSGVVALCWHQELLSRPAIALVTLFYIRLQACSRNSFCTASKRLPNVCQCPVCACFFCQSLVIPG